MSIPQDPATTLSDLADSAILPAGEDELARIGGHLASLRSEYERCMSRPAPDMSKLTRAAADDLARAIFRAHRSISHIPSW